MASFHSPSLGHGVGHAKLTKARSRQAVKPILKKLQSHSEKNSLDLDRSWEDQTTQFANASYGPTAGEPVSPLYGPAYAATTSAPTYAARPSRDVSFSLSTTEASAGGSRSSKYAHARSTSGTSHASSASGRNGSFVHPFQQTPRTSTPPLSYANSVASFENGTSGQRDYSPTITEDDNDTEATNFSTPRTFPPRSNPNPRRPSMASQRTISMSDVNQNMRAINRSSTNSASRAGQGIITQSRSDLQLNTAPASVAESSASGQTPSIGTATSPTTSAPATTPLAPLRSSLDMSNFRIRSRSEVDTATRQEQVREARRKFEEKEKAKEEKYAREQTRKEGSRLRKSFEITRKLSNNGQTGFTTGRNSCAIDARPSMSRKTTATAVCDSNAAEKADFAIQGYDNVPASQTNNARADDVHFQSTRRKKDKRRTTSAWTAFILWLRTKLLKLGRRS